MAHDEKPVKIVADPTLSSPRIYSNYVQVNASPVDCTLTFCEVIGPQSEQEALRMQETGVLPAPVKAVIAVPAQILDGLIQALQAQRDKHVGRPQSFSGSTVQ
ncbi:MAG: hypothetical protein LBT74_05970 [Acidobacteriota bacterium]|jgi:hypothetical protein|nr:hypothetical protein [Acidobacteriota bacterium]